MAWEDGGPTIAYARRPLRSSARALVAHRPGSGDAPTSAIVFAEDLVTPGLSLTLAGPGRLLGAYPRFAVTMTT
ncbi:MAG: hypothetical protein CMH59_24035 [Myxococcales bacterium]|nr:hypothetical protein [Myxococcales bacterium]